MHCVPQSSAYSTEFEVSEAINRLRCLVLSEMSVFQEWKRGKWLYEEWGQGLGWEEGRKLRFQPQSLAFRPSLVSKT